jgi:glycerol-3-phosphate dehydrogenase
MAGTTDDDYYGDLDRIDVTEDEVAYVLQAMQRSIPGIRSHRVLHTIQGVRPTLFGFGAYEDELSRDYEILDHGEHGDAPGLYSMTGGKLASYRLMAEDAANRLCAALGVSEICRSAELPLPGGDAPAELPALVERFGVGFAAVTRLGFRHGGRAGAVLAAGDDVHGRGRRTVCACEPVLDAELRHVARSEGLRKLTDCTLRVRLGVGACQGAGCAASAAGVLAEELGWDAPRAMREVAELAAQRWRAVAPVLAGAQVAAMEIHRHVSFGMLGLAEEIVP